jgi:hypothetical protein
VRRWRWRLRAGSPAAKLAGCPGKWWNFFLPSAAGCCAGSPCESCRESCEAAQRRLSSLPEPRLGARRSLAAVAGSGGALLARRRAEAARAAEGREAAAAAAAQAGHGCGCGCGCGLCSCARLVRVPRPRHCKAAAWRGWPCAGAALRAPGLGALACRCWSESGRARARGARRAIGRATRRAALGQGRRSTEAAAAALGRAARSGEGAARRKREWRAPPTGARQRSPRMTRS